MYVSESVWYQKQEKKKAIIKKSLNYVRWIFLVFVIVAALYFLPLNQLSLWKEHKENTQLSVSEGVTGKQNKEESGSVEAVTDSQEVLIEKEEGNVQRERPLIILDPGHGGLDEGCSNGEIEEKEINLRLAKALKEKLEEMGFSVLMTREVDKEIGLVDRTVYAQKQKGDLLISIHQNYCEYSSVSGIETWYDESTGEESKRLAKLIQQYLVLFTGAEDRGIMNTDSFYVIRESQMPSCLVETGFLSNEDERALLQDENYCEKLVQGFADAIRYYFYPKKMYLTFDDGPHIENTGIILDILKEKNIKASFFVVGENVKKYPDLIKRMSEEGHVIGIHCYNHSYEKLYSGVNEYMEDFEQAKKLIQELTGEEVWCYRFPGGSINKYNKQIYQEIIEEMSKAGYVYYDWNGCFEDAVANPSKEKIMKSAIESTLGRKKIVMLAHDTVDETAQCLEEVLERFPEYEFLPLSKEVEPIHFK